MGEKRNLHKTVIVRSQVYRALRRLRRELDEEMSVNRKSMMYRCGLN